MSTAGPKPVRGILTARRLGQAAWVLCLVGLVLAAGSAGKFLPAADPAAGKAVLPTNGPTVLEIEVTHRARSALLADPGLKAANLFVRVKDGTAILSGPVPSAELSRRAETILQHVSGVYAIRNDLYVQAPEEDHGIYLPLIPDPPTQSQSSFSDPKAGSAAVLAGRETGQHGHPIGSPTAAVPSAAPPAPESPGVGQPPVQPPWHGVTLLPPVALADQGPVVRPNPPAIGLPPPPPPPTPPLREVVARLQQSEARFRPLRVVVRAEGIVWVYDDPWRGEAVTAFAQALRPVPGVREVFIKSNSFPIPR